VGVLATKVLDPPADGRADTLWKLLHLLNEDAGCRVVLLSLCSQPPSVTGRIHTVVVDWSLSLPGFLGGLVRGLPIQVSLYRNAGRAARLAREVEALGLDVIVADMARTSLVAASLPARRRVLDMDDRLSFRYARQAKYGRRGVGFGKTPWWLPKLLIRLAGRYDRSILAFEASRLRRFEERICGAFDEIVLVSAAEASGLEAATGRRIRAIPNYIDLPPAGGGIRARGPATILYFGNMSTAHNVDTALFLAEEIFPLVQEQVPEAKLELVGRNMGPRILGLLGRKGISLHADVPEIQEHLAAATVCVCPMRFGSGIKTKILEALAAGLPVVTTPVGAEGIPDSDSCLVLAEGREDLARATVSLLRGEGPVPSAEAARRMVERHYSRESVRRKWLEVLLGP